MKKIFLPLTGILLFGALSPLFAAESSGKEVRMVTQRNQVEGCKFLGQVTGKSSLGGIAAQKWGQANAEREMRNKTEEMGGNVILVHHSEGGFYGAKAIGDAYLCPEGSQEGEKSRTPPQATEPETATSGGCTKDTDCKGDRICEKGKCVNP
jgi:hypothetical protein